MRSSRRRVPEDKVSIILLSGDLDKAMAAFMMDGEMASLEEQIELATEAGITFQICLPLRA